MRNREIIIVGENLICDFEKKQRNLKSISKLLVYSETIDAFCTANEVIDVNKYRHIRKKHLVQKTIKDNHKPFVFLVNKN